MKILCVTALAVCAGILTAGCKGKPEEKFVSVEGQVLVDGKPLTTGFIGFIPDEERGTKHPEYSLCEISPDGKFKLATNDKSGVRPGWYKVVVWASSEPLPQRTAFDANGQPVAIPWLVAPKYTTKETTDLFVEVVEKPAAGAYVFNLSPR
jgi:hypothetical protein